MRYEGILSKGFQREEFAVQAEQLKQFIDGNQVVGKAPDPITAKMMQQMEKMQEKMYASPVFLLAYTLLTAEGFYPWSERLPPERKQRWRQRYGGSEYDSREYASLFDLRQAAELDWLTGLLLSVSGGDEEDYQIVIEAVSQAYPTQRHFIKKREVVQQEEIKEYIKNEKDDLLKAGKILLFLILAEYFKIPIIKNGSWNGLESTLWKGLQFYQNQNNSKSKNQTQKIPAKFKQFLNEMMIRQGVHPLRLEKYEASHFEVPEQATCEAADWEYLWHRLYAMLECLWEDKACYKQLKQSVELTDADYLNRRIGELQKENDRQAELIRRQKNREEELVRQLNRTEKENQGYQLEAEKRKKDEKGAGRELIQLRNFVYELESVDTVQENQLEQAVAKLREKKILVIGGHRSWQQKMKTVFPEWRFLSGFQTHFSVKSMSSVQYFIVNTRMIKHKGYYRLLSECGTRQSILYCDEVNIEKSIMQIYGQLIHR